MDVVYLILLILAAVCFGAAAVTHYRGRPIADNNLNLVALGLLFWVLVPLIQTVQSFN